MVPGDLATRYPSSPSHLPPHALLAAVAVPGQLEALGVEHGPRPGPGERAGQRLSVSPRPHRVALDDLPTSRADPLHRVPEERRGDALAPVARLDEEAGHGPDALRVVAAQGRRAVQSRVLLPRAV